MLLAWMILGRVLASSGSAALQKRMAANGLSPTTVFAAGIGVLALALAPAAAWRPMSELPAAFWVYVALSVLLDVPGNILLAKSFHEGELSVVGPLAAYKPALGLLFAALWLGESPSAAGIVGVAVVLSGSLFLAPGGHRAGWDSLRALAADPGARFRLLSMVLTALQTVFAKSAINLSSALDVFLAWAWASALVSAAIWAWIWIRNGRIGTADTEHPATANRNRAGEGDPPTESANRTGGQELRKACRQWRSIFSLAALFFALALLSALILERMYVGYALALFQLSALLNVALGRSMFAEGHAASRAFASIVMIAGAVILILAG